MARTRGASKFAMALTDPSLPPTRVISAPWSAAVYERKMEPPPFPWGDYFDVSRPVEVDIGCGKGRFILAKARENPGTQYLGVEHEISRVNFIDYMARTSGLTNVWALRADAMPFVTVMLPPEVVDAVHVFFPDPWPKRKHRVRRIFNAAFLSGARRILKPGGFLHVATDQEDYFRDMGKLLVADDGFTQVDTLVRTPEEMTDFERLFLSKGLPTYGSSWRKN